MGASFLLTHTPKQFWKTLPGALFYLHGERLKPVERNSQKWPHVQPWFPLLSFFAFGVGGVSPSYFVLLSQGATCPEFTKLQGLRYYIFARKCQGSKSISSEVL